MSVSKGKKAISLCLVAVLLMAIAVTAVFAFSKSSVSGETYYSYTTKQQFVWEIERDHPVTRKQATADTARERIKLLQQLMELNASKTVMEVIYDFFVYAGKFKSYKNDAITWENENNKISKTNSAADVLLEAPVIIYDNLYDTWILYGTGKWCEPTWQTQNIGAVWDAAGKGVRQRLGGDDLFGIKFSEVVPDSYSESLYLVHSTVEFNNVKENAKDAASSESRADASIYGGVILAAKDELVAISSTGFIYKLGYSARNFDIIATYSSDFRYYMGNASTFTTHTYSDTVISSVDFSTSINPYDNNVSYSVSLGFSEATSQWTAYSGGQTHFE